jgi:hypothetical protein
VSENRSNITWDKPLPLSENKDTLPNFPVESFPEAVSNYVKALAENTQTSIDMSAVIALGILAVCAGRHYRIEGNTNYYEPLNLYILLVAEPGERKSSIMQNITKFLFEYEQAENERLKPQINAYKQKKATLESTINNLRERLGKSKNDEQLLSVLKSKQAELDELHEVKPLRLYADDCSSEALTTLLSENDGMMAVISAEGSIFDIIAGRYNSKINMDVWLKGHSGDEIRVDRKNRMTEYISNPRLTTVLAIQPSVLDEIMNNTSMAGRGLIARFLISIPVSRIGQRIFVSEAVAPEAIEGFRSVLLKILTSVPCDKTQTLQLTKEAQSVIETYFNENEILLSDKDCSMREWLAKNVGAVLRIAGILHLASGFDHNTLVSFDTMRKAAAIGRYFCEHARYAYSMTDADKTIKKMEYVLGKLRRYQNPVVKRREVFRDCRGTYFKSVADLKPILDILEEYGYLHQQSISVERTNRPSEIIHISPYINQ